tara:strand:+ start:18 stop:1130 length:1113 start_codon:yes stop_codon:yes gene_type:complete
MKVIIFFTYGISLNDWKSSGLLEREVKLYDYLNEKYNVNFVFITYGDKSDIDILKNDNYIKVIPIYHHFKKSKYKVIEIIKSFTYSFRLSKIISMDNCILKTNQLWGSWIPLMIKLKKGNPLIVRTGYDLLDFKREEKVPNYKIFFYKSLTKYSIKFSDKYLVTSNKDLDQIKEEFSTSDEVLQKLSNWVEFPKLENKTRFSDRIISVGRLEQQKNYQYLIKSFANSELEIDIVGQGSKKEELASLSESYNSRINFLGRLGNDELIKKLAEYKYYVSSTLYEGNPKAILEAMAAGCIVIAPNVSGVNEIIENRHSGILYNFTKDNLMLIIENLETEGFDSISENAREYIRKNHTLEAVAAKEFAIYEELL